MDVLVITQYDWANTGWKFSKCLELLKLDVKTLKGASHNFEYPNQMDIDKRIRKGKKISKHPKIFEVPVLKDLVESANVVHFMASTFIDTGVDLISKNVVVNHGGSSFRDNPKKSNEIFNPFVDNSIIQMPDLLGKGAKNEVLIYFPVDTNFIKPIYPKTIKKFKIGHFPVTPAIKGTSDVIETMNDMSKKYFKRFKYVGVTSMEKRKSWVKWEDNLERMSNCDIIIDVLNPEINGKPYGEWGNISFEASALGKIVITNSKRIDIYEKEYGECLLFIANNKKELKERLIEIFDYSDKEIIERMHKNREWVVNKHSFDATSKRLWNKVYKKFF